MNITFAVILGVVVSTSVTLVVRAIWDWAANKNGKSQFDEIKKLIEDQKKDYSDLKETILLEYVKKTDIYDLSKTLYEVRDMAMTNKNNIDMIKETSKQYLERVSMLENRIAKME